MKKILIVIFCLAIIAGFLVWKFGPNLSSPKSQSSPITINFWGLWEDDVLIKPIIDEYKKTHPNISINYTHQSSINYRTRVQTQIEAGVGPDVFMIHNSWLNMFYKNLYPAPSTAITVSDFQKSFYQVASDNFIKDNQIYAAPMEIDGLALYYNEEILNAASVQPPKNWQEFTDDAVKMTVKDATGQIKTSGGALGTASNVDYWSDILGLLLLQQPNINFSSLASSQAAEVFRFYTGFVIDPKKKTWDQSLPTSSDMFVSGRLAFYFAPSWKAHELRVANPNLKFKIVPVPQLPGRNVASASYWAEAVSIKSPHPQESWDFVKFLTSSLAEKLAYQEASKVRLFGEPYSRIDLGSEIVNDPLAGAFVLQGPIYKSWFLNSRTYDVGINDEMIKYFEDGINKTLAGTDPQVALQTVDQGVRQVLDKYTKPQTTP